MSVKGVAGGGGTISAGTQTAAGGTVVFSNQNGVTFGLSTAAGQPSTLTATVNPGPAAGLGGAIAGTQTQTSGSISFQNSNGVTFGLSNSSVLTASVAPGGVALSAAGSSQSGGTVVFSNSNGLSFGMNGSTVTGSYSQATPAASASNGSFTFQTLGFSNANNVTFGTSAGSIITASVAAGGAGGVAISAAGSSQSTGTVVFSNSNGVTFGMNGATVTASVVPGSAATTLGAYAVSQSTGQSSSSTFALSSLPIAGYGAVSVGMSAGTLQVSAPAVVDFTQLSVGMSTGGNTSGNTGLATAQLVLAGTNGITLSGSTNGGSMTITISGNTAGGGGGTNLSAFAVGNTTNSSSGTIALSAFSVSGLGAISAGVSGSAIQISGPATSSLSGTGAVSLSTNGSTISIGVAQRSVLVVGNTTGQSSSSSYSAGSLNLSAAGGISIGNSGGTIIFSGAAGGAGGGINAAAGTQTATSGTVVFANSNGISFGMSGSSQITASYTVPGATVFSNSNNVSFGLAGSTVTATATFAQSAQSVGIYGSSQTVGQSSSSTVDARSITFVGQGIVSVGLSAGSVLLSATTAQSNQTIGLYATGNTTNNSSTTFDARTAGTWNALGAMTLGFSNGSVQVSAPATSSLSATGQVSISTNGSTISIGVPGQLTYSYLNPVEQWQWASTVLGQGSMFIQPVSAPNVQFDRVMLPVFYSQATNSTITVSATVALGLYTRNVSTLSLVGSTSSLISINGSGTASSSVYSGIRGMSLGSTTTLTGGQYYLGVLSSTATAGGAPINFNNMVASQQSSSGWSGMLGQSSAASNQVTLGLGFFSAATASPPSSVAFSAINGTGTAGLRPPVVMFTSGTV